MVSSKESASVIVIGAGVAGLSAAVKLTENGFKNVKILESSERIGGRIYSVAFGASGAIIDMGAQWISGKNEVYKIVKDHVDIGETLIDDDKMAFLSTDSPTPDDKICSELYGMASLIYDPTEEMLASEETFGEFAERKFYESLKDSELKDVDEKLIKQILFFVENEFNAFMSAKTWHEVPAKRFARMAVVEGNQLMTWKNRGYRTLLEFIVKRRPDKSEEVSMADKVFFNKKVVNINWSSSEQSVKCLDGSEFSADHVIVTIPLGVLKARHEVLFTALLPKLKIESIESLGYGTLGKFFLQFKNRILPDGINRLVFLWSDEELKKIHGTEKEWLLNIYGFIYVDENPNLLEGLVAGDKIDQFENFPESKISEDSVWLLEKFLKKSIEKPLNVKCSNWLTNENFLGSYSYPIKSRIENPSDVLGESITKNGNPAVMFAGEATEGRYIGYVHGALRSGWRVADELIAFYAKPL